MHPFADFKYCPQCGNAHFRENDAYSKRCMQCGFVYYANAAAATVAIILNEQGELLCVVRDRQPAKGTLDLPGGFVDPGESITQGLVREVQEEVGADVVAYEFLFSFPNTYPFCGHVVHTSDAFFLCRVASLQSISARDDATNAQWIPLSEVDPTRFGLASIRQGVERFLAMQQGGGY